MLLRQAFSNLLRNAVEACVDASSRAAESWSRGGWKPGNVRVSVEDNGPGMPSADRERIFRPFVTTKGRGTGLGLALVQKIIVTHNGRIQVPPAAGRRRELSDRPADSDRRVMTKGNKVCRSGSCPQKTILKFRP